VKWDDVSTQIIAAIVAAAILGAATWVRAKRASIGLWLSGNPWASIGIAGLTSLAISLAVSLLRPGPVVPATSTEGEVPAGAIVAFEGDKCPDAKKWTSYSKADGRTLIGAATPTGSQVSPIDFMTRADLRPGATGGTHLVNVEYNLPPVNPNTGRPLALTGFSIGAMADASVIFASEGGKGSRYYVLPPYLAVVFCVKN
jgi:hypothetical protein